MCMYIVVCSIISVVCQTGSISVLVAVLLALSSSVCFNDTATTYIYTYGHTLSLHDALPIFLDRFRVARGLDGQRVIGAKPRTARSARRSEEHTSELQSLLRISYAVFCLKKTNPNLI